MINLVLFPPAHLSSDMTGHLHQLTPAQNAVSKCKIQSFELKAWCFSCQWAVIKIFSRSLWNIAGPQSGKCKDNTELEHLEMEHHPLYNWFGYMEIYEYYFQPHNCSWSLPVLWRALTIILSSCDSSQHISQHFWPIIALYYMYRTCFITRKQLVSLTMCVSMANGIDDVFIMV